MRADKEAVAEGAPKGVQGLNISERHGGART